MKMQSERINECIEDEMRRYMLEEPFLHEVLASDEEHTETENKRLVSFLNLYEGNQIEDFNDDIKHVDPDEELSEGMKNDDICDIIDDYLTPEDEEKKYLEETYRQLEGFVETFVDCADKEDLDISDDEASFEGNQTSSEDTSDSGWNEYAQLRQNLPEEPIIKEISTSDEEYADQEDSELSDDEERSRRQRYSFVSNLKKHATAQRIGRKLTSG